MNTRFQMAVWVVGMVVGVAGIGCAAEPAVPPEWVAAYTADLTSKNAAGAWWTASGETRVVDGKLVLTPGRRRRSEAFLCSYKFPGSLRVEVVCSALAGERPVNVSFDLHMNADVAVGTNDRRGYVFQFRARSGSCILRRGDKVIGSARHDGIRAEGGKPLHIIAERSDAQVSVSIDGTPVLSVKDDGPLESPALNMVGLGSSGCTLNVEKFVVSTRKDRPGDVIDLAVVPAGPQITVRGPAMCARGYAATHGLFDGCPHLAIYALDGTPEIKAEFDRIMDEFYPEKGLDCDEAVKLLEKFDEHLKYYIVPSALANRDHTEHDYPSRILSVTGTFFERYGKKWIAAEKIEPAEITYPARMLAPDKPFVMPDPEPLVLKVTDTLTLRCIKLPPGRYLRGSPFYEHPRWQDETPHEVVLTKSFYMSEIPVTQEMFEALVGKNPSRKTPGAWKTQRDRGFNERFRHKVPDDGPDFAVEHAEWADIQEFCRKLSELNGRTVRVPTEGEWEYAARVGTSNPCFTEKYLEQRSFVADGEGRCEPVRRHKPNAWGFYDMVKSGWELVSDYKLDNVREKQIDPQGPPRRAAANHGGGPLRRTKGGCYYGDTHLNLHGACDEHGDNEEGIMIFRVVVEAE